MPTLPSYTSQASLNVRRPDTSAGDTIRQIGVMALELGAQKQKRELADIEFDTKMKLVEQKNQVDGAKINTANEIALLDEKYNANPTSFEDGWYEDELAKIGDRNSGSITSTVGDAAYRQETQLMFTKSSINARSTRNKAVIEQRKATDFATLSKLQGSENRLMEGNDLINSSVALGIYTQEDGQTMKDDTVFGWALADANTGASSARAVLDLLKNNSAMYPMQDIEKKNELFNDVKAVLARQTYVEKVKVESDKVLNARTATDIIANPNMDDLQKVAAIKNMGLSKANTNTYLGALNQSLGIQAFTNDVVFEELSAEIDAFNVLANRSEDGKNVAEQEPANYFQRVEDYRAKVVTAYKDRQIGPDHYMALLSDIDEKTDVKMAQAVGSARDEDDFGVFDLVFDNKWENQAVQEKFTEAFPSNTQASMEAFSSYYLQVEKNKKNDKDSPESRQKIVDSLIQKGKDNQLTLSQQVLRSASRPVKVQDGDTKKDKYTVGGIYQVDDKQYKYLGGDSWEEQ